MLHLIPAPLHRVAYRCAHALRKVWWRVARPTVTGCRVLVFNQQEELLLIRHSYGNGAWMPPGGAIDRGEMPVQAAVRELLEETGCHLTQAAALTVTVERLHGAGNQVHVICGKTSDAPKADQREIIAAQFFPLDSLPKNMPQQLLQEMPGWIKAARVVLR